MTTETLSSMQARLAQLEAENSALRASKPERERVRPVDPEAKNLASIAGALAKSAGLKSGYVQPDARAFLDGYTVEPDGDDHIIVTSGQHSQRIAIDDVESLAAGGRPTEGYASLKTLTTERLYIRKLSVFLVAILAQRADEAGSEQPEQPEQPTDEQSGEQSGSDTDES